MLSSKISHNTRVHPDDLLEYNTCLEQLETVATRIANTKPTTTTFTLSEGFTSPFVKAVEWSDDHAIVVYRALPMRYTTKYGTLYTLLSPMVLKFKFTLPFSSDNIRLRDWDNWTNIQEPSGKVHPHQIGRNFCLGSFLEPMTDAYIAGHVDEMIFGMMRFLYDFNQHDSIGMYGGMWFHHEEILHKVASYKASDRPIPEALAHAEHIIKHTEEFHEDYRPIKSQVVSRYLRQMNHRNIPTEILTGDNHEQA